MNRILIDTNSYISELLRQLFSMGCHFTHLINIFPALPVFSCAKKKINARESCCFRCEGN